MLKGFSTTEATALCTFGYCAGPGQEPILFEGATEGNIVPPRGPKDFGWVGRQTVRWLDGRDRTHADGALVVHSTVRRVPLIHASYDGCAFIPSSVKSPRRNHPPPFLPFYHPLPLFAPLGSFALFPSAQDPVFEVGGTGLT